MLWCALGNGAYRVVKKNYPLLILPALGIIILDQISKLAIQNSVGIFESVPVIRGFFNIVHVRNRGIAFGFLNRLGSEYSAYLLIAATLVAIGLLVFWFTKFDKGQKGLTLGFSFILGGAVGNLIDRVRLHEVIDFLDFHIGQYHWPAFNVADSAITVGTLWVAYIFLFRSPPILEGEKKEVSNIKA